MPLPNTMNAALLYGAKDIQLEQLPIPEVTGEMVLIKVARVGICGSDLHYYAHGECGPFIPDRPFVLGHEFCGELVALGDEVTTLELGQRVTVNPARFCGRCQYCRNGRPNLCKNLKFTGTAATKPPTNGGMADYVTVRADQCHVLPEGFDDGLATMIEPFAVGLHAVKRAGVIGGKRVLVLGAGTIGLLTALTAKAFGASWVAVSDVADARLEKALSMGIDGSLNPTSNSFLQEVEAMTDGGFDIIFEASGAPPALRQAFDIIRPGGTIVQIGTLGLGDIPIPANEIMVKELNFIGSMRYNDVFDEAIELVQTGRVDLSPFITGVFPLSEITPAFAAAADKTHALKIQVEV